MKWHPSGFLRTTDKLCLYALSASGLEFARRGQIVLLFSEHSKGILKRHIEFLYTHSVYVLFLLPLLLNY